MADKGNMEIEKSGPSELIDAQATKSLENEDTNGSFSEKATATHLEVAKRKPYWDSPYVMGAGRREDSFTSEDEVVFRRPNVVVRLWQHCKRHWKLYTVLAIIALAIGLPILFKVIFPAIAQRLVDDSDLPIQSASIMKPTPNSVEYSLVASLKVPAGVTVVLKPFNLSLYTPATGPRDPYIKVALPEYHLKGREIISITNQTAEILDKPQMIAFLDDAVGAKNFTLAAYGSTAAYLGILKAPITLKKNIKMPGLWNLTGFDFTQAAVIFPPLADGTNLKGEVVLPNHSYVTFELGNVTLNMIVGGIVVGQGRIDNVVLRPGNNTVPIKATVDIKTAIQNLPTILASQTSALKSGNLEVSASGNSTIYNGQHIDYYEKVLNELVVTGQVPIIQVLLDSATEFLGSDTGSLLTGFLNNLNLTSLTGTISGLLGGSGGNSTSGSSSSLSGAAGLLTGILGGLANSSSSSSSSSDMTDLITGLLSGLGGSSSTSKRAPTVNLLSGMIGLARLKSRFAKKMDAK